MTIRKLTLILFLSLGLIAPVAAQSPPGEITLSPRIRDAMTGQVDIKPLKIDPRKVGIIIIDPWNYHWCMTACQRVPAMAPRWNRSLQCARELGIQILWAPTEAASQYAGTPQRERAAAVSLVPVPQVRKLSCAFTAARGGCMCGPGIPCEANYGLDGICSDLVIDAADLIVCGTAETYPICRQCAARVGLHQKNPPCPGRGRGSGDSSRKIAPRDIAIAGRPAGAIQAISIGGRDFRKQASGFDGSGTGYCRRWG